MLNNLFVLVIKNHIIRYSSNHNAILANSKEIEGLMPLIFPKDGTQFSDINLIYLVNGIQNARI